MIEATVPNRHRDVVVLGAGFSHALSDLMPLTDELGEIALQSGLVFEGDRNTRT